MYANGQRGLTFNQAPSEALRVRVPPSLLLVQSSKSTSAQCALNFELQFDAVALVYEVRRAPVERRKRVRVSHATLTTRARVGFAGRVARLLTLNFEL